jgi:uncharacterized phage-associated protein
MANVFDVAAYLLSKVDVEEGDGMAHLKLQKFLYCCQGFSLVLRENSLFENAIEACPHGPVVPDVYHEFKKYDNRIIEATGPRNALALSDEERELIDEDYEVYGDYFAMRLRNQIHNERPWQNAIDQFNPTITKQALLDFFPSLVNA